MKSLLLFLFVAQCSFQLSAEVIKSEWYEMSDIGYHYHGEAKELKLSEEKALLYFNKEKTFLSKAYKDTVLNALLKDIPHRKFDPKRHMKPRSTACIATVAKVNSKEVVIRVIKPLGGWRWHHHFEHVISYKVKRSKHMDEVFSLNSLYNKHSYKFNKLGYGSSKADVLKVLGKPDFTYPSQSFSLAMYFYEKENLHVRFHGNQVYFLEKGEPSWVKSYSKEK